MTSETGDSGSSDVDLLIIGTRFCRRTRKIVDWLKQNRIPFEFVDIESERGQALARQHKMRAAPGIVKGGRAINPFDLLRQCKVSPERAREILSDS